MRPSICRICDPHSVHFLPSSEVSRRRCDPSLLWTHTTAPFQNNVCIICRFHVLPRDPLSWSQPSAAGSQGVTLLASGSGAPFLLPETERLAMSKKKTRHDGWLVPVFLRCFPAFIYSLYSYTRSFICTAQNPTLASRRTSVLVTATEKTE